MDDLIERLLKAEARLDKQANAIKALRERVVTLEREKSLSAHPASGVARDTGAIALPDTCLMCGEPKGVGHNGKTRETLMTCQTCADLRREGINSGGAAREAILVSECRLCGTSRKSPTTMLLCRPCRKGVDQWREESR